MTQTRERYEATATINGRREVKISNCMTETEAFNSIMRFADLGYKVTNYACRTYVVAQTYRLR